MTAPSTATPTAPASTQAVTWSGVSTPPRARTGTGLIRISLRQSVGVQGWAVAGFGPGGADGREGGVVLGGESAQFRLVVAGAADESDGAVAGRGRRRAGGRRRRRAGRGRRRSASPPASARIARSSAARAARSARGRSFSRSTTQRTPPATAAATTSVERPPRQPPVGQHHDPRRHRASDRRYAGGDRATVPSQVGPSLVRGGRRGRGSGGGSGRRRTPAGPPRPRAAWRWPSPPGRRPG